MVTYLREHNSLAAHNVQLLHQIIHGKRRQDGLVPFGSFESLDAMSPQAPPRRSRVNLPWEYEQMKL